jgi:hypothetical protein
VRRFGRNDWAVTEVAVAAVGDRLDHVLGMRRLSVANCPECSTDRGDGNDDGLLEVRSA